MFGVWGSGFGGWGLGVEVWGLGCGVWGLGPGVWGLGFRLSGLGFGVSCLKPQTSGFTLKINCTSVFGLGGRPRGGGGTCLPRARTLPLFPSCRRGEGLGFVKALLVHGLSKPCWYKACSSRRPGTEVQPGPPLSPNCRGGEGLGFVEALLVPSSLDVPGQMAAPLDPPTTGVPRS